MGPLEAGWISRTKRHWRNIDESPDIVLLEGWFIGFKAIPEIKIEAFYGGHDYAQKVLQTHELAHLQTANYKLKEYNRLVLKSSGKPFDALIHLDFKTTPPQQVSTEMYKLIERSKVPMIKLLAPAFSNPEAKIGIWGEL